MRVSWSRDFCRVMAKERNSLLLFGERGSAGSLVSCPSGMLKLRGGSISWFWEANRTACSPGVPGEEFSMEVAMSTEFQSNWVV